jgi:quercetin dioxygenase-like cupin family protein
MQIMNFASVSLSDWDSPNITARTLKAVPFAEGAEQVDFSFIRFPPGVHSTYHVHNTDQVLIAADGVGFIETADDRAEFRPGEVVHCPAGERHRHGAVPHAHLDQVSVVVASRLGQQRASGGGQ